MATVVLVARAAYQLQRGADTVEQLRVSLDIGDLAGGRLDADFAGAEAELSSGASLLGSPVLAPVRVLPVIGRQLRAARALGLAAAQVTNVTGRAAGRAQRIVADPPGAGSERLEAIGALREAVVEARAELRVVDLGPSRALVGPVATARAKFERELDEVRTALARADAGLQTASSLLGGPSRYLLLVASNAEMRAGSGMFLSAGLLSGMDGSLALGEVLPTGDLTLEHAAPITDADLRARWGAFEPSREWRNLAMSPRFDVTAQLASSMWEARVGTPVDGVLALDVEAVRAVLAATGPIEAAGRTVSADNVVDFLLHDQYVEAGAELGGRQFERRDQLGGIANAAIDALDGGDFSLGDLAEGLADAVRGRHLLAWARDPRAQQGWEAAGATGTVTEDALMVALLNRGANKLDRFVDVSVDVAKAPKRGQPNDIVQLQISIRNRVDAGEIAYIAGPNPATATTYGQYKGIVAVTVPGFATAIAIEGVEPVVVAGRDGESNVIGGDVRVPGGGRSGTVTVTFEIPRGAPMRVLPSARLPAVVWRHGASEWNDSQARTIPGVDGERGEAVGAEDAQDGAPGADQVP